MMKFFVQYASAITLLAVSSLFTWYEGSAIREHPYEWPYTAFFSQKIHGEVLTVSDISVWDHFVYAAKFSPLFPSLMIISIGYLLCLTGIIVFRNSERKMGIFHSVSSVMYGVLSFLLTDPSTTGGTVFMGIFSVLTIIHIILAVWTFMKKNMRTVTE
ncbi:YjdJ family protein [Rossellomorea aquimaris]|uniref:DUF4306 domain-containing protein n=1 Tax=Rossellomorea aquimaris TaxID=189382 RepID=UPI001CD464B8|nr:DUF4306 domain-containing protein [Rossellomorea aquimaris]MCA1053999.1 YjdJ family protein [Rossellomorea aquimaris]